MKRKVYQNITEMIGETPLLRLGGIEREYNLKSEIYAKVEKGNPTGSVKDRAALGMVLDAERKGLLKEGGTIIEPTSGNTGIALAAIAASRGYKAIIVMPESMSIERRNAIAFYGAELVLTPASTGMKGAVEKAEELHKQIPNSIITGQFVNPSNSMAHYLTTGPEIYDSLDGELDYFIAGIGTGGTISGVGRYLKEKDKDVKIIGVEPFTSPLLTKGNAGPHKIQGIGANFIPEILERGVIDEVIDVADEDAFTASRILAKKDGLAVGISSGAALSAAIEVAKRNEGKRIVVLLPDGVDRYYSTALFK
ncbi:MAG: cysteine synthase A [Bacilli bacterium]|nr:cysteine synthase A [Bacilli bacterium]